MLLAIPSQFRGWIGSMHVSEACHLSHFDWLHGFQTSRYPPHCPVLVRPRVRKTCCRNRSARWIWNHVQLLSSRSCQTFPAPSPSLWLPQKRNFFKVPKAVITLPNPQPDDLSQKSFEHQRIFEHFFTWMVYTHTCHTHICIYIYIHNLYTYTHTYIYICACVCGSNESRSARQAQSEASTRQTARKLCTWNCRTPDDFIEDRNMPDLPSYSSRASFGIFCLVL